MTSRASAPLNRLKALEPAAPAAEVLAFYDSLPPLEVEELIGAWRGTDIATGHPFDGLLGPSGWHGKNFRSPDDVDPLVFRSPGGKLFAGDPARMPMGLLLRLPRLARLPLSGRIFRAVAPLLFRTRRPRARLRMTNYRGVSSATMIYDALPINDVFRKVDADTMLGAMDIRGVAEPFFFVLRREQRRP